MAKEDIEYKVQEPSLFVLIVAVILGSGVSFILAADHDVIHYDD